MEGEEILGHERLMPSRTPGWLLYQKLATIVRMEGENVNQDKYYGFICKLLSLLQELVR